MALDRQDDHGRRGDGEGAQVRPLTDTREPPLQHSRRKPMSEKFPAPADVRYDAYCEAGKEFPGESDAYFKVQREVPRWGVGRAMQVTISRNVEPAQPLDIWMQDFGVTMRDGKIILSMQLYDTCGTSPRI